jgi:hypothetical protein
MWVDEMMAIVVFCEARGVGVLSRQIVDKLFVYRHIQKAVRFSKISKILPRNHRKVGVEA